MLSNPDAQPNTAMNRWLAGISLFNFQLKHVPGAKHAGPDGLSRRPSAPEDEEDLEETSEDVEEWVDEILGCSLWVAKELDKEWTMNGALTLNTFTTATVPDLAIPSNNVSLQLDNDLHSISDFLKTLSFPASTPASDHARLRKQAYQFFMQGNCLWCKEPAGRHQLVVFLPNRLHILRDSHDKLGHKGFYSTRRILSDRFWWPSLDKDLQWYLKTCHQCQTHSATKVILPPSVSMPASLFQKNLHRHHVHAYVSWVQSHCTGSLFSFLLAQVENAQD
jgi:hypothetical protein